MQVSFPLAERGGMLKAIREALGALRRLEGVPGRYGAADVSELSLHGADESVGRASDQWLETRDRVLQPRQGGPRTAAERPVSVECDHVAHDVTIDPWSDMAVEPVSIEPGHPAGHGGGAFGSTVQERVTSIETFPARSRT
jgi:hypothetical protein